MPANATTSLPPSMIRPETEVYRQVYSDSGKRNRQREEIFINSELHHELLQNREADAIVEYFSRRLQARLENFRIAFDRKFLTHKQIFESIDLKVLFKSTALVATYAAATNPSKITADLTEDMSVIFTLVYDDGREAYLELFFESNAQEPVQHNFNVYKNSTPVLSYAGGFIQTLKYFLSQFPVVF